MGVITFYTKRLIIFFIGFITNLFSQTEDHFVTTWKTTNSGISTPTQITIPAVGKYDVDWNNDGIFDEFDLQGTITHSFVTEGTYTVRLRSAISGSGSLDRIFFNNGGDSQKIISIDQWGTTQWLTFVKAFMGCTNIELIASDIPNLTNVTNMEKMFYGTSSMTGITAN